MKSRSSRVILNTPEGAKFQRPKSACNFVNRLLRMAGLVINSQQIRTGEMLPDTGKEKRVRRYSINQESLACMSCYAQSRAAHKQVYLAHTGVDNINRKQSVTTSKHKLDATLNKTLQITLVSQPSAVIDGLEKLPPGPAIPENQIAIQRAAQIPPE